MCSTTRNFDQSAAFTNKVKLNKTWQENPRVCLYFVGLNPGWCTPYTDHLYMGGRGGEGGGEGLNAPPEKARVPFSSIRYIKW